MQYSVFVVQVQTPCLHDSQTVVKLQGKLTIKTAMRVLAIALTLLIYNLIQYEATTANVSDMLTMIQTIPYSELTQGISIQEAQQIYSLQIQRIQRGTVIFLSKRRKRRSLQVAGWYPAFQSSCSPTIEQGGSGRQFSLDIWVKTCLSSGYNFFKRRQAGDGCHLSKKTLLPVKIGSKTKISSHDSIELIAWDPAHTPKITIIAKAPNFLPPISVRYSKEPTKKPLLITPNTRIDKDQRNGCSGTRPAAKMADPASPNVLVLRERQTGQMTCPVPEAMRKRRGRGQSFRVT